MHVLDLECLESDVKWKKLKNKYISKEDNSNNCKMVIYIYPIGTVEMIRAEKKKKRQRTRIESSEHR